MAEKFWYVVAKDSHDADDHVDAWGEFDSEIDARAFAIDLANDNGWVEVEPVYDTPSAVAQRTTEYKVLDPYRKEPG